MRNTIVFAFGQRKIIFVRKSEGVCAQTRDYFQQVITVSSNWQLTNGEVCRRTLEVNTLYSLNLTAYLCLAGKLFSQMHFSLCVLFQTQQQTPLLTSFSLYSPKGLLVANSYQLIVLSKPSNASKICSTPQKR